MLLSVLCVELVARSIVVAQTFTAGLRDAGRSDAMPFTPGPRYGGQIRKVIDELFKLREENTRIVVVTRQAERLAELLREREFHIKPTDQSIKLPAPKHIELMQGALAEGMEIRTGGWTTEDGQ